MYGYSTTVLQQKRNHGGGGLTQSLRIALGPAALGWAFPTSPIHTPGKFSPGARHLPSFRFSFCFPDSPQAHSSRSLFPFLSTPPPHTSCLLCFFSLPGTAAISHKHPFACLLPSLSDTWRCLASVRPADSLASRSRVTSSSIFRATDT